MNQRFYIVIVVAIVLMFLRLGGTSVFQVAEARNSQCAYEMMINQDHIVPMFNNEIRTDKPALEYYAMITAYKMFGVNEAAARFWSAMCGLIVVICTFLFVRKNVSAVAAWWSSFILLSSMHMIIQFRLATPDPYLILFHVLSLYCFWEGFTNKQFKWHAAMYVLFGLGMFAKGPVGFVIPAFTIFLYFLFTKQFTWKNIVQLKPWFGLLLMAVASVPWYYLVHKETNGEWTNGFFLQHNVGRFDEPVDNHGGIFLITFLFVILGMFPFSLYFIRAFKFSWKERKTQTFLLFNILSFAAVVVFYFFSSTRLLNYTTPAYPFLAILIGCWLTDVLKNKRYQILQPELIIISIISLLIPFGVYIWASNTEPINNVSWIAFPLLLFPIAAILTLRYRKANPSKALTITGAVFIIETVIVNLFLFPAMDSQNSMIKHKQFLSQAKNVVAYQAFNDAFVFYVKQPIHVFDNIDSLNQFISTNNEVTILNTAKKFKQLDSLPNIKLYSKDRDIFSTKSSAIYIKK